MKNIIKIWMFVAIAGVAFTACTTEEPLDIQKIHQPGEQYYKNIRDYKKSDHAVAFAYYEGWAQLEGVDGYKKPASYGERLIGLPDSIDIVNLWMGIPSKYEDEENYSPIAYEDMRFCQTKLGTRFVMHADASHYRHQFTAGGQEWNMGGSANVSDQVMDAYALYIYEQVEKYELDGVDIDFEGWSSSNLTKLVQRLGKWYGPQGENPDRLLIVDYFSASPSSNIEPYIDYLVKQQYSDQLGYSDSVLDSNYRGVSWCPSTKYIICEQFGNSQAGPYGGFDFSYKGETMKSIYAFALWNPSAGRKGGFGVYFLGRNYYSLSGVPYGEYRQAIQLQNPAGGAADAEDTNE